MSTLLSMILKEDGNVLNERAMSENQVIKLLKLLEGQFLLLSDVLNTVDSNYTTISNVISQLKSNGVEAKKLDALENCCKFLVDIGRKYANNTKYPLFEISDYIIDIIESNQGNLKIKG